MILESVKKNPTLSEKAYRVIRDAIVTNRLAPGEILTEEQLSEMLSISRTPVRTAINKLTDEGLLIDREKGLVVTPMTTEDVDSIALIRKAVEPLVIDKLQGKVTAEMIDELRALVERQRAIALSRLSSSEDYMEYIDVDFQFHTALARWTQDRFLLDIVSRINTHSTRGLILSSSLPFAHKKAVEEHASIIDNLEKENYVAAREAMEHHISNVHDRFFQDHK